MKFQNTNLLRSDDALAKLRSLFTKETAEPVRGTALLPGSVSWPILAAELAAETSSRTEVCYCFQDVRKEKELDQPQMQPVVWPGRFKKACCHHVRKHQVHKTVDGTNQLYYMLLSRIPS